MTVGAVCENSHIRSIEAEYDDIEHDPYCRKCGEPVHSVCPNCNNAPIKVDGYTRDDGSPYWRVQEYCHHCGEAYPWGPSRFTEVTREIAKRLPEPQNSGPNGRIYSNPQGQFLEQTKHGSEIINHVREGDQCYRHRLWHSALTCYIHAFEWAAIAYLEHTTDVDIIAEEQNGNYYNFAGGRNSILDELTEHAEIDQKTVSKIESMNRAERRWMAHHKSGQTLQDDVDQVRSRLTEFIETLFPTETVRETIDEP
ncbi:DUF2321 domain-containing protein [Halorubrum sp. DTA46]|uniref:DUF2321 domain-containing protein n=1 Tax=Halorubrum sp. DTA46 TaxID=3402162 RepID=UPI003AAC49BB